MLEDFLRILAIFSFGITFLLLVFLIGNAQLIQVHFLAAKLIKNAVVLVGRDNVTVNHSPTQSYELSINGQEGFYTLVIVPVNKVIGRVYLKSKNYTIKITYLFRNDEMIGAEVSYCKADEGIFIDDYKSLTIEVPRELYVGSMKLVKRYM